MRIVDHRQWNTAVEMGRVLMVNGQMQLEGFTDPKMRQHLEEHRRFIAARELSDEEYLKSLLLEFSGRYIRAGFFKEG